MSQFSISGIRLMTTFAVGAVLSMNVYAQGMGPGMGMGRNMPTFAEYDLNNDGKIIEQEFNQARANRISARAQQGFPMRNVGNAPSFQALDRNGDGNISADEFAAHQSGRVRGQ